MPLDWTTVVNIYFIRTIQMYCISLCTVYKLIKKRNFLSMSTAFIFSKLNTCKYFYEHNKIQQLRHKLNKFHRHVTNRIWNNVSLNKGGGQIQSNNQCLVWPPAALSTAVHLLLIDCTRFASSCSAVLGVSQFRHCNLLPWPHLQSSCLLAACLRHVHTDEQGPWASFFWCF